jgi:3-phenylpropionate/trans-cinnamate dioxygenase ferredoxin reductase component
LERAEIVIVGGGLAGAAAAENYRKAGGSGTITIISQDKDRPVHRPPLSKEFLRGDKEREEVFVHPANFYDDNRIVLKLRTHVEAIDLSAKELVLSDSQHYGFDTLVLATGARPRKLRVPGADLQGIHYLRTLKSSERLQEASRDAKHAVIIGAGFIGMEVAASLTVRGVKCTVVEVSGRMWSHIVPEVVSGFIESFYREHGVDFRFGVGVQAIEGEGRVRAVTLENGESLPADLVVAGIGAMLNTSLAENAELNTDKGVIVDEFFRASLKTGAPADIYAIGDIAMFPDPVGGSLHTEHWDNALQQGRALGKTLAGQPEPYDHVAYFFSDMFDLSLNMMGYPADWDDIIVRGDPKGGKFTVVYVKDETVRAVLMINDDQYFDGWPVLIRARRSVDDIATQLADPAVDPKSLSL